MKTLDEALLCFKSIFQMSIIMIIKKWDEQNTHVLKRWKNSTCNKEKNELNNVYCISYFIILI